MKSLLFLILLLISSVLKAEIAIVVGKDSQLHSLQSEDVVNIFMSRTNQLPIGGKALPIELQDTAIRSRFYQQISSKSARQLNAYWATLVFTGKGKPPKGYDTLQGLSEKLRDHPGAIAYLPLNQVTNDMKVVYKF